MWRPLMDLQLGTRWHQSWFPSSVLEFFEGPAEQAEIVSQLLGVEGSEVIRLLSEF